MKKIAILLAADETRMMSKTPAAQHTVCGKPMVEYVIGAVKAAGAEEIFFEEECNAEQLCTVLDAMQSGLVYLIGSAMPLVEKKDLEMLAQDADCFAADALGCVRAQALRGAMEGSECIADAVEKVREHAKRAWIEKDRMTAVEDRVKLAAAEKLMRARINEKLMLSGVTLIDPENTYIEDTVVIGQDTVVYPGCTLQGNTVIGRDCVIYPHCRMSNAVVGDGTTVEASVLLDCAVGSFTTVGPNAYLRPKTIIGDHCRIGDFVEVKNSAIGNGTKVSHLTYVGDADLGENINLGCGVVFSNYDGKKKYRSVIGDNAFIGCNVNIVSPVNVGDDAYIAAGSTITGDVPGGSLAIARERQINKAGWVDARKAEGKL